MDSGFLRRRTIALVAAYAVALQTLFAAFAPVAIDARSGALAALCAHDSGDGSGQPASHDLPCAAICAAMGHGIAGTPPSDVVIAGALPRILEAVAPLNEWVPPRIARTDVHSPRGPPLA